MIDPRRYDRPAPRYTSYPTAPVWKDDLGDEPFLGAIRALSGPVSVYVHIPFCAEQCTFCGCSMLVAGRREAGPRYLDGLEKQLERMSLPGRLPTARIHLGGGTPTWLDVDSLRRLYAILDRHFPRVPGAEGSVEADPEVTTDEQLSVLHGLGVTRLSLGVQSFDPRVLAAVNRPQRTGRIEALVAVAKGLGMRGLNLDLLFGLPFQTADSWADTLEKTLALAPDRLAVFAYAHVPWLKPHQRKIDAATLPSVAEKNRLREMADERLTGAGYVAIGLDHYARPDDELAVALREGRLHRNFMGYTTLRDVPLVGLGMSAISELGDVYAQVQSRLPSFYAAVERGGPLIEKAIRLSAEDRLRKDLISELMCNLQVDFGGLGRRHGVEVADHLRGELAALAPLEADGIVETSARGLRVTAAGRPYLRNVAMAFDAYLSSGEGRFSRTVG